MVFLEFINENWVRWIFAAISTALTIGLRVLWVKMKEMRIENSAMNHGIRALLHNEIIREGKRLIAQGYCTPEEFDDLMYLYEPYHDDLDGNGSAERIVEQVKRLPNRKPQEQEVE